MLASAGATRGLPQAGRKRLAFLTKTAKLRRSIFLSLTNPSLYLYVTPPNEVLFEVHQLADAYCSEGMTANERARNIVAEFRDMPPVAQRELLNDFRQLITYCPDLYPQIVAAACEPPPARRRFGF